MPKLPDFNNDKSNPRSPHTIPPKNDRGLNSQRDRQIETPNGYEFYNGELIGPASKLTQRDRETILVTHPFFQSEGLGAIANRKRALGMTRHL